MISLEWYWKLAIGLNVDRFGMSLGAMESVGDWILCIIVQFCVGFSRLLFYVVLVVFEVVG